MKNYLKGFGVIMAVGFAFALLGSNGASTMLATILDTITSTTTPNTATTTVITDTVAVEPVATTSAATTTTPAGGSTTTTNTVLKDTATRTAYLSGLTANQVLQGAQILNMYATDGPASAEFVMTNLQTNQSSRIDATCAAGTITQEGSIKCVAEIGTLTYANGKYSIGAHVTYADGATIASNQVSVYIYNARPTFAFASHPTTLSGMASIGGEISTATGVEFFYTPSGTTNQIRIGNGIYAGGVGVSKWTYEWDTTLVSNGSYKVIARATSRYNNGEPYQAGEMTINVLNEVAPTETAPKNTVASTTEESTEAPTTVIQPPKPAPERQLSAEELTAAMTVKTPAPSAEAPTAPTEQATEPGSGMQIEMPGSPVAQPEANEQTGGTQENAQSQATQNAPVATPTVPTPPIVQKIQDIAIGLQSGNDSAAVERKVAALQKELWGDVNPGSSAVQAGMQYQSAKQFGTTVNTAVMRVAEIALSTTTEEMVVSVATTTTKGEPTTIKQKTQVIKEKLRFAGKALPNMYVTLYIYSEVPTIAVVKADRSGNWVYELNNKLADGKHEAYVTINDRTGKVVAKSSAFGFVKTAEAITVENAGLANLGTVSNEPIQPVQAAKRTYSLIVFMIIGLGLLIGVLLVVRSFRSKSSI